MGKLGWIKVGLVQKLEEYWECLEHHYSTYHVPSLGPDSRVNGLRTRSENLADHLGLAASYWAFRKLSSQNNHEFKSLVGLDIFSHDQMFFLSFAHVNIYVFLSPGLLLLIMLYFFRVDVVCQRPR